MSTRLASLNTRLMNLSNRDVLIILFLFFAGGSLWSLFINLTSSHANFAEWGESWLQNFSTEMFGAFLTFILLTLIVGSKQEKHRLIRQLASGVNEEARRAAEELQAFKWINDGALQNTNMSGANLQNANLADVDFSYADLSEVNLEKAHMSNAILKGAFVTDANLQGAFLLGADLREADIRDSNLQFTRLFYANLENADLSGADLRGVTFADSNLQGANLENAKFNENTILPDKRKWKPETELNRFTDSTHPDFWRPRPDKRGWLPSWYRSDTAEK